MSKTGYRNTAPVDYTKIIFIILVSLGKEITKHIHTFFLLPNFYVTDTLRYVKLQMAWIRFVINFAEILFNSSILYVFFFQISMLLKFVK